MPIKHVVMFGFKPDALADDIKAFEQGLLGLPAQCPQILHYELGNDLRLDSGLNHPLGPNRQMCWSVTCATVEDYLIYNASEPHKAVLQLVKPILAPGTRAAVQYEITV
mmetsp:Transcript_8965/g.11924  ORF Transcript_8965/g.11924 Transcript_8965/m.11924 type:complete len:109 (+) Transcript_8965:121-447(+)